MCELPLLRPGVEEAAVVAALLAILFAARMYVEAPLYSPRQTCNDELLSVIATPSGRGYVRAHHLGVDACHLYVDSHNAHLHITSWMRLEQERFDPDPSPTSLAHEL